MPRSVSILTRVGLPAIAGVASGMLLTSRPDDVSREGGKPVPVSRHQEARLPEDPAIIRIAALAGRNAEVRSKLRDLLAAGAKDAEIAEWLAIVLFHDPGWLETFILTVPEDRRVALTRLTIMKVGELQADAAWELLRHSSFARQAARSEEKIEDRGGIDILGYCMDSRLAADTVLDPEFGFSDKEVVKVLRFVRGEENHRRILDEWMRGRWEGEPPEFVREAWPYFRYGDKESFAEFEKRLPAGLRGYADQFDALNEQEKSAADSGGVPNFEELASLGPGEFAEVYETQRTSGTHIPLETLVRLPQKLRQIGLEEYFSQSDSFHPEMAREGVEKLDHLDLTDGERQSLLEGAAKLVWEEQGDYQTALEWISRMPAGKDRNRFEGEFLTDLAKQDPASALEHLSRLPAGGLREKIERIAMEAQP